MKILLFAGTGDGHDLALWLAEKGIPFTVSVATEYGETLLPEGMDIHVGRLDAPAMKELMGQGYTLAVDATHPYAVDVTKNIRAAAEAAGLPYLRLLRQSDGDALCRRADSMEAAAELLLALPGNVLLTTGSKELHHFARPGLRERCFPRVLPMVDSLERCLALGFPPRNILCMQGPFSKELNAALIRQYAALERGLTLIFDRPRISPDELNDPYGMKLVELLVQADARRNAVCVANDELARRLRARFPKLALICHVNRLVAEPGKRTPELYERLGQLYTRLMLHPDDAVRPGLTEQLSAPLRFDAVVNDPCLRHCPVRRDHLQLLSARRARPCDMELPEQIARLCARVGCLASPGAPLAPPGECRYNFLTREECHRLYNIGLRCFHIQAQPYRNEVTLLWDALRCMFDWRPEHSHYCAAIAVSVLAGIGRHRAGLPSGLTRFQSSQPE